MTQRDEARARVRQMALDSQATAPNVEGLAELLARAQNGPPLGCADGTLEEAEWEACKRVAEAFHAYQRELFRCGLYQE